MHLVFVLYVVYIYLVNDGGNRWRVNWSLSGRGPCSSQARACVPGPGAPGGAEAVASFHRWEANS